MIQNDKKRKRKARAVDVLSNRQMERTPRNCFRCGFEYHIIEECPKPPKDNEKLLNQVRFHEKVNHAYDNCEN